MDFTVGQIKDGVVVVAISGSLNDMGSDAFLKQTDGLIAEGVRKFVLDCTELDFVSSFGLGVLVRLRKRFAEAGGRVALGSVPDEVMAVLKITALDKVLMIYPDVETARLSLMT